MLDSKVESFLRAAQLRSYTAAAQQLHLTQPAITQHIHKLESYYGCRLIDSTGRTVQLTEAGERLYRYLQLASTNEQQMLRLLRARDTPLRVGATLSIADYYLPEALVPHLAAGDLSLQVRALNSERLVEQLSSGELDCAFIEGIFDPNLFAARVFYQARFLPVAAASHPLAGQTTTLAALHDYPLALREAGSGTRELLESYLYQYNDSASAFARVHELGSFALIKELLLGSQAVSFMYEGVARREVAAGSLCFLQLTDYHCVHPLHFIYRRGSPQTARVEAFFEQLLTTPEECKKETAP